MCANQASRAKSTFPTKPKYDEAIRCFKKARDLHQGHGRDAIELEIIRVSVAKGDYGEALSAYKAIPGIELDISAYCSLGTLYRKIGSLLEARQCFNYIAKQSPTFYNAHAGLAEAAKQSGRFNKAIKKYQSIFQGNRELEVIDESSWKVYSLALSALYRLAHQPGNAGHILRELSDKYPNDNDVHIQLAKLRLFEGDIEGAQREFAKVREYFIDSLASRLFLTAMGKEASGKQELLPEEQGLANCNRAYWALAANNFTQAYDIVTSPHYVDRLHADFGAVLRFHAAKGLDASYDYRRETTICRIRKRGYKELRNAVVAISEGNLIAAHDWERRACLLIG